ncbi:hypothetical protein INH39_18450 [Massilia violaceinigra]|uniref:DUF4469 domain-containing protein n=1 Tax=Massilia violaceinigra TaxID=2045208 RepID=A0ABY3ZYF3_9BURK|nr:hypothetical protein [Massilia violaceinigra]UOD27501.1 hypothetical protein INH39_18450 [Massilia violaceinigra]
MPSNESDNISMSRAELDYLIRMAGKTSRIVQQAASTLEEEIALGVAAAKRVEMRFVDVDKLRAGDPADVMQRFRRDAHEVVDILLDMVVLASNSLGALSERVVTVRPGGAAAPKQGGDATASLKMPQPIAPGGSLSVPMTLENAADVPTGLFRFHCADLLSESGARLAAAQIAFVPEQLFIAARSAATVHITVTVPPECAPGTYSGLLLASALEQVRAVLTVQVESPGE